MSRFQKRTEEFAGQYMTSSKYTTTIAEDMSFSGDDPSKRNFRITFSQPSSNTPVPPAVAYVLVRVWFEGNKYVVKGYQVEGKKQLYEETFKFNEAWIDRIIAQKMSMRATLNVEDDEFLKTRIVSEAPEAAPEAAPKEGKINDK